MAISRVIRTSNQVVILSIVALVIGLLLASMGPPNEPMIALKDPAAVELRIEEWRRGSEARLPVGGSL